MTDPTCFLLKNPLQQDPLKNTADTRPFLHIHLSRLLTRLRFAKAGNIFRSNDPSVFLLVF